MEIPYGDNLTTSNVCGPHTTKEITTSNNIMKITVAQYTCNQLLEN